MSRTQKFCGVLVALVVGLGLAYAGWRVSAVSRAETCQACGRAVHADMRAVASVGDRRGVFCCPACALSQAAQLRRKIRFATVADYSTGKALSPADAFAVAGSGVVPCVRQHEMLNRDGLAVPMAFDRCSPSIIAFATRAAAEGFAAQHGGKIGTFQQLVAQRETVAAH
jgi:hypothetical protein